MPMVRAGFVLAGEGALSMVPALDLRRDDQAKVDHVPANLEAEQALLGALLYDNSAYETLPDGLRAEHFYEPLHQRMFAELSLQIGKGHLADPILLSDRFAKDEAFTAFGGVVYLADLVDRAPPAVNAPDYARQIMDLAMRRAVLNIAQEAAAAVVDPEDGRSAREHVESIEGALYSLAETGKTATGFVDFATALAGAMAQAAEAFQRDGGLSGISTGLIDLDDKIGGLHGSDLVILAARPSMGKTSMACNIAFDIARKYAFEVRPDGTRKTTAGGVVAFFSLEMSAEQLALRLVSEVSGVSGDKIRKGKIDATEFGRIRDASLEIDKAPLYIDATGGISLGKLAARARRLKRLHGLDAIFIDYLQLMTGDKRYGGGQRVQEVSEITVGLKALAKELNVPVIALSQLSRQVEQREDKKPQLSDLRESGSIEQDADMVMFIYREEYYLARTEPNEGTPEHAEWLTAMDAAEGVAEVIIGKQRHGPIGTVRLAFDADLTKFSDQPRNLFHGGRKPHGDD